MYKIFNYKILFYQIDVASPEWNHCPSNMIVFTDRGTASATPIWLRPTVTDNSGEQILVVLVEGFEPGSSVSVGSHNIRYEATDREGNSAPPCSFVINVRSEYCVFQRLTWWFD